MNNRDQKKQETRQRIYDAARELFRKHGFYDARASDIAKAAGVAHGSVFAHFENKQTLLLAINEDLVAQGVEYILSKPLKGETGRERAAYLVTSVFRWDHRDLGFVGALMGFAWNWDADAEERFQDMQRPLWKRARAELMGDPVFADRPDEADQALFILEAGLYECLRRARARPDRAVKSIQLFERLIARELQLNTPPKSILDGIELPEGLRLS